MPKYDWAVEPPEPVRVPAEKKSYDWAVEAPDRGVQAAPAPTGQKEGFLDALGRMMAPSDLAGNKTSFMGREIQLPGNANAPENRTPVEPTVGKNLGYLGGILSTAGIQGLRFKDKKYAGDWKEIANALKGYAKPAGQQLEEAGTPGFIAGPAGIGVSLATDPFLSAFDVKMPVSEMASDAGKAIQHARYKNAFKDVDTSFSKAKVNVNRQAATPFTDQLIKDQILKAGMSPMEQAQAVTNKMNATNGLGEEMNEIWNRNKDVRVPPARVLQDPEFAQYVQAKRKFDANKPAMDKVADEIRIDHENFYPREADDASNGIIDLLPKGANPDELTEMARTALKKAQGKLGATADTTKRWSSDSLYKEGMNEYSTALRDLRDKVVGQADPEVADKLAQLRHDYGIYFNAEKPMHQLATKFEKQKPTQVEGSLTLLSLLRKNMDALAALAGKGGVKYMNTPQGAVRIGNTARALGDMPALKYLDNPIWQRMLRQKMEGMYDDQTPPEERKPLSNDVFGDK